MCVQDLRVADVDLLAAVVSPLSLVLVRHDCSCEE
jgi:hypothetical protein